MLPPTPLRPGLPFRPFSEDRTFLFMETKACMCTTHTVGMGTGEGAGDTEHRRRSPVSAS